MRNADFASPLQQIDRVYVQVGRRKLLYFGGCDYHRLSSHPKILQAIHATLDQEGLTTAASRKTTGNHRIFESVEKAAAKFFKAPCAVLLTSGYLANIAVAQGLHGRIDQVFLDERCHGSLIDALPFIASPVAKFPHRDAKALEKQLAPFRNARTLVVTDGMFAFDGSLAPVKQYRVAAGPKTLIWVDDAHACGVMGEGGRGSIEAAGIGLRNVIQTVTFSKAFGVYGGAILCSDEFRGEVILRSSAVGGNTPLPLPIAAGVLRAVNVFKPARLKKLRGNIRAFWRVVARQPENDASPIIAVARSASLSRELAKASIYPTLISYPGGPVGGYFRFALSSEHTREQVMQLAGAIQRVGAEILSPVSCR